MLVRVKVKRGQAGKAGGEPLTPAAWVGAFDRSAGQPLFYSLHHRAKSSWDLSQGTAEKQQLTIQSKSIYTIHIQMGIQGKEGECGGWIYWDRIPQIQHLR